MAEEQQHEAPTDIQFIPSTVLVGGKIVGFRRLKLCAVEWGV